MRSDYNTDEDANPDTAEEGRAKRAAAGSSGGHSESSGSSKRGEVAKKKKEEDQLALERKEREERKETKDADAFRKLLASGINVGGGGVALC